MIYAIRLMPCVLKYYAIQLYVPSISSDLVRFKAQKTLGVQLDTKRNSILKPEEDLKYFDKFMSLLRFLSFHEFLIVLC